MSKPFHQLPHESTFPLKPFKAEIPQDVLDDLKRRIGDTPEIRDTYENSGRAERGGEDLGVKKDWLSQAIAHWKGDFDWYVCLPCLTQVLERAHELTSTIGASMKTESTAFQPITPSSS